MLARARRRLRGRAGVLLARADMRALALAAPFDLVVAADDPFSHLVEDDDRDRALAGAAAALRPGGTLVLDALRVPFRASDRPGSSGPFAREHERTVALRGRRLRVRECWRFEPPSTRCRASYEYWLGDRLLDRASFEARFWTATELSTRLARAGFTIDARWGGHAGEPWDERSSTTLLVRARRV